MNEVEAASAKAAFIAATDELIAAGRETGNWMSDQALQERNPVAHGFADGLYTRQIEMPASSRRYSSGYSARSPYCH